MTTIYIKTRSSRTYVLHTSIQHFSATRQAHMPTHTTQDGDEKYIETDLGPPARSPTWSCRSLSSGMISRGPIVGGGHVLHAVVSEVDELAEKHGNQA